ncbi:MAG: histidine utilization repressor [Pseudomonadota bacterium]
MSLHERILKDVEQKIVTGEWPPGHRIPFETDMAKDYGCSRMTVNKVLTQLSRAGLLERNKKRGTFVKAPQSVSAALEITNIRKEVEDAGKDYSYALIDDETRQAMDHEAKLLDITMRSKVRHVKCLHFANGEPFCIEDRVVNIAVAAAIEAVTFDESSPGAWMFKHVPWNNAEHQILATEATPEVAKLLNMDIGAACLVVERKTQNDQGFVTWARLSYAGSQHRLIANFTPTS